MKKMFIVCGFLYGSCFPLYFTSGLCAIAAHKMGASTTVLTDQQCVLQLLETNVAANCELKADETIKSVDDPNIQVLEYVWGSDTRNLPGPFQYVLISDCINSIYGEESWMCLARSIGKLTASDTVTYMSTQLRDEGATLDSFLKAVADLGLTSELVQESSSQYEDAMIRIYKFKA